jgi:hypothetical protein
MRRIQIIQNLRMHRPRPQPALRISDDRLMNGRFQKQLASDLPSHNTISEGFTLVIPWGVEY